MYRNGRKQLHRRLVCGLDWESSFMGWQERKHGKCSMYSLTLVNLQAEFSFEQFITKRLQVPSSIDIAMQSIKILIINRASGKSEAIFMRMQQKTFRMSPFLEFTHQERNINRKVHLYGPVTIHILAHAG